MSEFNFDTLSRWENQKEWDAEPEDTLECCEEYHESGDYFNACECDCHLTKADAEAEKADQDYHDKRKGNY